METPAHRGRILVMIGCCLFRWILPCRATVEGAISTVSIRLDPSFLLEEDEESLFNNPVLIRGGDEGPSSGLFGSNATATPSWRIWPADRRSSRLDMMSPWRRSTSNMDTNSVQQTSTSRRRRPLEYRDILNCDSRQWSWTGRESAMEEGNDEDSVGSVRGLYERNSGIAADQQSYVDYRGKLEGSNRKLSHSPVVYQYYGRSRIRGNPSDSVHFILLGPNVDHWKAVGQVLASRGFNTIACERLEKGDANKKNQPQYHRNEDAPNLVLEVMEALKWKKVILVGCDTESILAMETAMMLSPDQVVGLVLAGDLASSDQVAAASGVGELGSFLQRVLECPFLIIWDGDLPTVVSGSSAHKALETDSSDRCVILGGGSAPHRLKPEQFAWVLTRFVEERLEISIQKEAPANKLRPTNRRTDNNMSDQSMSASESFLRALNLPFGINTLVSPEGRLLLGRAIAAGLFYITAMRIIVIQYGLLRVGLIAIKSRYESIDALTKKGIQAVGSFIVNFGYIPRLFTVKRANEDEEDENRRSGTIVLEDPRADEEADEPDTDPSKISIDDDPAGTTEEMLSDPDPEPESPRESEESGESEKSLKEEYERPPLFKPFFFLDNVVT